MTSPIAQDQDRKKIIEFPPSSTVETHESVVPRTNCELDLKTHTVDGQLISEVTPVKHVSDRTSLLLSTVDNDLWKSTGEEKSRHYMGMPSIPFDEDITKNKGIQEWALNLLPLTGEQKEKLIVDLEKDRIREENMKTRQSALPVPAKKIEKEDSRLPSRRAKRLGVKEQRDQKERKST